MDLLIRELIQTARAATPEEIAQIVDRIAAAPFDPRTVRVPVDEQGVTYLGITLGTRAASLDYHLVKRVVVERQWAQGTTAVQYTAALRRAARDSAAQLVVYERRSGHLAATITPTDRVLSAAESGPNREEHLLVIYSADRGIIVTGHQFSALDQTGIPPGARWLK